MANILTIWLLDPMDTYCLSNFDKVDGQAVFHEWLSDNLAGATANRQLEGDDVTYSTAAPAERLGNYMQISRKEFIVSETLEVVNKAGRRSEVKRLATKLLKELKRDMEQALCTNQASSAGGATTVRSSAGIESWIEGPTSTTAGAAANVVTATTSAASATTPGFSGGTVAAPTDGSTTGTLTEGQLKAALNGSWEDGGNPSIILVGATQKTAIDNSTTFPGVATRFVDVDRTQSASIIGAASVYVSSFGGPHTIVLSRYVRSSVVLCLDPEYWAVSFLRRPFTVPLAKTGDAQKRMIAAEYTLICRNQFASSKVVACA